MAFVIYTKIKTAQVDGKIGLSFLEALVKHNESVHILSNYVAAIKAYFFYVWPQLCSDRGPQD